MSKVLELYKNILESNQRFVDEVFENEEYRAAVPQLTIIDLGAYEGEFSFYCYNFAKKIYAIEADPRPYKILAKRIKKYELDRIKSFPIALSGSRGKRIFHASGYGGSRLLESEQELSGESDIKVDSMSLAQFMAENNIDHVDILKVDIEQGEDEVFNAPDFKDVVGKIDLIIGEHLLSVDGLLKDFGFEAKTDGINTVYQKI